MCQQLYLCLRQSLFLLGCLWLMISVMSAYLQLRPEDVDLCCEESDWQLPAKQNDDDVDLRSLWNGKKLERMFVEARDLTWCCEHYLVSAAQ